MAFARVRFSNVVTAEIAKEAIDFLTKMYREFDSSVAVVHDPRDAAGFEIANFLQENPNIPYDFGDLINDAVSVNPFVEAYLGKAPVNNNSYKYRDIAARFKEGLVGEGFISIVRENPLRLVFKPDAVIAATQRKWQHEETLSPSSHEVGKSKSKTEIETETEELGQAPIPCIFCDTYKTSIEFDLGNHLLEHHRMDLVKKLNIGKGDIEYRINHAIQLGNEKGNWR